MNTDTGTTDMDHTDDSEPEFTETTTRKKRKLTGSPEIGKWNFSQPLIIEINPMPNQLELARTLRENFGEGIGNTKPLRSNLGFQLFTKSPSTRKQITTEKMKSVFPSSTVKVREVKRRTNPDEGHYIIKGIDVALSLEDVKDELARQDIFPKRLNRINSLKFNAPTRLVRVITNTRGEADKAIQSGVLIGLQHHRCEAPHNNEKIQVLQCYNCQGFGHMAANCEKQAACARCGEQHPLKTCERPKTESKCANCQQNHPASYKGCPSHKEEVIQRKRLYSQAVDNKKPVTKAEITKSLEETIEKTGNEIRITKTRIETDYKQIIQRMEDNIKQLEENTYVFVASITLWLKNYHGEGKKTEAARALGQVAEIAKRSFGKEFNPNLMEYKRK